MSESTDDTAEEVSCYASLVACEYDSKAAVRDELVSANADVCSTA